MSYAHQIYNMAETDKVLVSVVSDNVLNHQGSHVSASHCQAGQGGRVYDLKKNIIAYSKRSRKNILSITKKKERIVYCVKKSLGNLLICYKKSKDD